MLLSSFVFVPYLLYFFCLDNLVSVALGEYFGTKRDTHSSPTHLSLLLHACTILLACCVRESTHAFESLFTLYKVANFLYYLQRVVRHRFLSHFFFLLHTFTPKCGLENVRKMLSVSQNSTEKLTLNTYILCLRCIVCRRQSDSVRLFTPRSSHSIEFSLSTRFAQSAVHVGNTSYALV